MSEYLLALAAIAILFAWVYTVRQQEKRFDREREDWQKERKDLLDRIQAPSFQDYANKVIREKKAEKQEEDKQEAIHFIS